MFSRFGCLVLSAGLILATPVWAEDEKPPGLPPEAAGLQQAAYDVIVVPRRAGAVGSRIFNGERWVTVPDGVLRPYLRPYLSRDYASGGRWSSRNSRESDGRFDNRGYQPRSYAGRTYADRSYADGSGRQNRYQNGDRTSERRYYRGAW